MSHLICTGGVGHASQESAASRCQSEPRKFQGIEQPRPPLSVQGLRTGEPASPHLTKSIMLNSWQCPIRAATLARRVPLVTVGDIPQPDGPPGHPKAPEQPAPSCSVPGSCSMIAVSGSAAALSAVPEPETAIMHRSQPTGDDTATARRWPPPRWHPQQSLPPAQNIAGNTKAPFHNARLWHAAANPTNGHSRLPKMTRRDLGVALHPTSSDEKNRPTLASTQIVHAPRRPSRIRNPVLQRLARHALAADRQ
jgi:hypothetical protein